MALGFLEDFGKAFVPKKFRPHLREYAVKAGVTNSPYKFFGILFYITLFLTFSVFFTAIWPRLKEQTIVIQLLGAFLGWAAIQLMFAFGFILIVYFYLDLTIYRRVQMMETVFPDYLTVVATNLKGGMTLDRSMFSAIKKRFGPLAQEMTTISKKVMTGYDLADALDEFSCKYNSPMIRRAMNLISGEIESGGKIAYIIDQVVHNMKSTQKLKAEMSASVLTYMIFIGAIVVVVAPALFALSYHLLSFMSAFTMKLAESGAGTTGGLPFSFSKDGLDTGSFKVFAYVAIIIVAVFSSMIVSIIEKGTIKAGVKYIPIFTIGAFVCFSVFMLILGAVFTGITI
jgi:Flp pilus assembly protein TadB